MVPVYRLSYVSNAQVFIKINKKNKNTENFLTFFFEMYLHYLYYKVSAFGSVTVNFFFFSLFAERQFAICVTNFFYLLHFLFFVSG